MFGLYVLLVLNISVCIADVLHVLIRIGMYCLYYNGLKNMWWNGHDAPYRTNTNQSKPIQVKWLRCQLDNNTCLLQVNTIICIEIHSNLLMAYWHRLVWNLEFKFVFAGIFSYIHARYKQIQANTYPIHSWRGQNLWSSWVSYWYVLACILLVLGMYLRVLACILTPWRPQVLSP